MTRSEKWIAAVYALNAMDAVSTVLAKFAFGANELNPLLALAFAYGTAMFMMVKLGVMTGVCLVLRSTSKHRPRPAAVLLLFAAVCFGLALFNNIFLMWLACA